MIRRSALPCHSSHQVDPPTHKQQHLGSTISYYNNHQLTYIQHILTANQSASQPVSHLKTTSLVTSSCANTRCDQSKHCHASATLRCYIISLPKASRVIPSLTLSLSITPKIPTCPVTSINTNKHCLLSLHSNRHFLTPGPQKSRETIANAIRVIAHSAP